MYLRVWEQAPEEGGDMRLILTPTKVGDLKPGDLISYDRALGDQGDLHRLALCLIHVVEVNNVEGNEVELITNRVTIEA